MQNSNRQFELALREIIRETARDLIAEDYGADIGGFSGGWGGGIGMSIPFSWKDAVWGPIKDAWDTGVAGVKELAVQTKFLVKNLAITLIGTFVGDVKELYKETWKEHDSDIQKIHTAYAPLFAKNDEAFKSDFAFLVFATDPGAFLSFKLLEKSAGTLKSVTSFLSNDKESHKYTRWVDHISSESSRHGGWKNYQKMMKKTPGYFYGMADSGIAAYSGGTSESILRENDAAPNDEQIESFLNGILKEPGFVNTLVKSPKIKKLTAQANSITSQIISDIQKRHSAIQSATTIEQLTSITRKPIDLSKIDSLPENEKATAKTAILAELKKAETLSLQQDINAQVDALIKSGVPSNNKFIAKLKSILQK